MKLGWMMCSLSLGVLSLGSCGEGDVKASDVVAGASGAAEGLDLSKLSPEAMKNKVGELGQTVATKLDEIKDLASAESARAMLDPIAAQLGTLEQSLGANMPALASLQTAIDGITQRLGGDAKIMEVLQPLLDKLTALMR
jgi:hypothetical protein